MEKMSAFITSQGSSPCFVCDDKLSDVKKLKTHLLLKHPKMNLCLFCVENKGWSDNFASQSSYNEHYWAKHKGVIENKANKQQELRNERKKERQKWRKEKEVAKELGLPLPKKPRRKLVCSLCTNTNIELDDIEYDRHLISRHDYDYCKICYLMGPRSSVGFHIAKKHPDKLCYICCSSSPKFAASEDVRHHMLNKHVVSLKCDNGIKPFPCFDCNWNPVTKVTNEDNDNEGTREKAPISFSSCDEFFIHLQNDHHEVSEKQLIGMNSRRSRNKGLEELKDERKDEDGREVASPLYMISGITNETGLDCFSISVLHLLAQTDLIHRLRVCELPHNSFEKEQNFISKKSCNDAATISKKVNGDGSNRRSSSTSCKNARCILSFFLRLYNPIQQKEAINSKKKRLKVSPSLIVQNYLAFDLDMSENNQVDCGDFLRGCLRKICQETEMPKNESGEINRKNDTIPLNEKNRIMFASQDENGTTQPQSDDGTMDVKDLFQVSIEWKFECESCHRYIVINLKEYVLKIDGSKEGSLSDMLQKFLYSKVCRCGNQCSVEPTVKNQGKYLFIEVDRSIESNQTSLIDMPQYIEKEDNDSSSKELHLYSLRLDKTYRIFDCEYSLFGTVNYNLELDEGGHYITYLFPREDECFRIHETEIKSVRKKPDFDVDTVIVALKKTNRA